MDEGQIIGKESHFPGHLFLMTKPMSIFHKGQQLERNLEIINLEGTLMPRPWGQFVADSFGGFSSKWRIIMTH